MNQTAHLWKPKSGPGSTATYPSTPNSSNQEVQRLKNDFRNDLDEKFNANNMCNPATGNSKSNNGMSFADFNTSFDQKPQHNRDVLLPPKFSDENPLTREVEGHKVNFRKYKIWVSSLKEQAASQLPENFSVELVANNIRNIRYIKPVQLQCVYTVAATVVRNAFVQFPDMDASNYTSDGISYHGYFPVIQGTLGNTVEFNYIFSTDYLTEIENLDTLRNKLRVKVLKESPVDGTISDFVELDSFAVEIEFGIVGHTYSLDKQAVN